ncbi:hypothetical protein D3C77_707290 [compost metagenome]
MHAAFDTVLVGHQTKDAMHGRQFAFTDALDCLFVAQPVMDQVGDGADLDSVSGSEHFQIRATGHGAVVVEHFDND